MRVHHLDGGTLHPPLGRLINGNGSLFGRGRLVCHVAAVETGKGVVLIDTGFGSRDINHPETFQKGFLTVAAPILDLNKTIAAQLSRLGIVVGDVTDIIMTHLDVDHAGGLADFPDATVHLADGEYRTAVTRELPIRRKRYSAVQWAHGPNWKPHKAEDKWQGICAAPITAAGVEFHLVALPGHTAGHSGVAFHNGSAWMLHAGDSYYLQREVLTPPKSPPFLLNLAERNFAEADADRLRSQQALQKLLSERNDVTAFCSHDPETFDQLARAV